MRPLYIFDLDGTLADISHRRNILNDDDPSKWRRFYAACHLDKPNEKVLQTLFALSWSGADIWFFSGRSDEVRDKTEAWLAEHTPFMSWQVSGPMLRMRPEGDYTADDDLKRQWYNEMLIDDRQRLVAVFDDRDRVVKMWRSLGVTCFQVADGDF